MFKVGLQGAVLAASCQNYWGLLGKEIMIYCEVRSRFDILRTSHYRLTTLQPRARKC